MRDETLGDLFRASATRFGGKTALVFGSAQLSYQELDGWSDSIADQLHAAKCAHLGDDRQVSLYGCSAFLMIWFVTYGP